MPCRHSFLGSARSLGSVERGSSFAWGHVGSNGIARQSKRVKSLGCSCQWLHFIVSLVPHAMEPANKKQKCEARGGASCLIRLHGSACVTCTGRRGKTVETDQQKIDFIEAAMDMEDPFTKVVPLDAAVESALGWLSQLPPEEVISAREALICEIEGWGECLRSEGHCDAWLRDADPLVRQVADTVNGPLLEGLAAKAGHLDVNCVEFFREGATWVRLVCASHAACLLHAFGRCPSVWPVGALGCRCSS